MEPLGSFPRIHPFTLRGPEIRSQQQCNNSQNNNSCDDNSGDNSSIDYSRKNNSSNSSNSSHSRSKNNDSSNDRSSNKISSSNIIMLAMYRNSNTKDSNDNGNTSKKYISRGAVGPAGRASGVSEARVVPSSGDPHGGGEEP